MISRWWEVTIPNTTASTKSKSFPSKTPGFLAGYAATEAPATIVQIKKYRSEKKRDSFLLGTVSVVDTTVAQECQAKAPS
jgi:hypothetical protein